MAQLNIGIFLPLTGGWNREVARGVAHYARGRAHWRLFLFANPIKTFHPPAGWVCHGAIARVPPPSAVVPAGTPLVYASRQDQPDEPMDVAPDHHAIGRTAAEHLHEIGFRRMTFYGAQTRWSLAREAGFRETASQLGAEYLDCPVRFKRSHRDVTWTDSAQQLGRWLATVRGTLGFMGTNDGHAGIAAQACQLAGLHVPEQVAIVGVDNDVLRCEMASRPLSSVDSAPDQVGFAAAEALDQWLVRGRPPSGRILIPPRGVVRRQSTDVLAIEDADVATALRFVRDHAFEPLGVDQVADAAGLSRSALERRFKRHVGRSVQQEITRLRVQRACERLRMTDDRLDRIAADSGFRNLAYFHSTFKRVTGKTPVAYRRWVRPV